MRRNSCHGRLGRRTRHQQSRALAGPLPGLGLRDAVPTLPVPQPAWGGCGAYGAGQWPVPIMLPCQRTTLRPTSNSNTHQSAPADAAGGSPAEARSTARGMDAIPSPDRPRPVSWGVGSVCSLTDSHSGSHHSPRLNQLQLRERGWEGGRDKHPQQGHLIQDGTWQQHPARLESGSSFRSHSQLPPLALHPPPPPVPSRDPCHGRGGSNSCCSYNDP